MADTIDAITNALNARDRKRGLHVLMADLESAHWESEALQQTDAAHSERWVKIADRLRDLHQLVQFTLEEGS